ncbi:hypothetical protein H2201_000337 [Coniosporium apollinis]|uniref:HTH APSES-type domain-containing protein n=2 Tax=Coniosporium TaxID=2810619 RepID=A0ABQ9P4L4_9PEZI|nr:hypothetical protein H2201_000337 [Coniosporium apollinis]
MVHKRKLPEEHNPLLGPEHTPPLDILIERRRLGQTNLVVKPGQVGISNATKAEALGKFDYAHLRVPLPKDLRGSGIFSLQKNQAYPESYFLMRRSSDGHISATGMFKAAFPWASIEEEAAEREYHKSLRSAGPEEVAGNVWIAPEQALKLAEEYHMLPWIVALLDPEPIEKGTKDKDRVEISTPPRFVVPDKSGLMSASSVRLRSLRSASPSKNATPSRRIATPRKARTTRNSVKNQDATAAGTALQNAFTNGVEASKADSVRSESVDGDTVRVEVDETVETTGDTETTTTIVKVDMPAGSPELPLPESTEEMIAKAKAMVEEANRLEENRVNGVKALKRKAADLEDDEDDEVGMAVQPAKRVRTIEEELKKEKVKNKALIGLSATLAFGALLPYFL